MRVHLYLIYQQSKLSCPAECNMAPTSYFNFNILLSAVFTFYFLNRISTYVIRVGIPSFGIPYMNENVSTNLLKKKPEKKQTS